MKVSELKDLLKDYDANADIQINISDGFQIIDIFSVEIDEKWDKKESFVLAININDEGYCLKEEN